LHKPRNEDPFDLMIVFSMLITFFDKFQQKNNNKKKRKKKEKEKKREQGYTLNCTFQEF
jgi:hypothetical protein